jgi:membrane protein DedA with SNARE-associated domain
MDIEHIVLGTSYVGIFGLMVANGFASFPSSQILYIIVGYFVSTGTLGLLPASIVGAVGNTVGNVLLYEAIRRHGIRYLSNFPFYKEKEIKKVEIALRKRGPLFLFVGKLLPAIKVFIPVAAAIGHMHRGLFTGIMLVSSWLWSLIFISIGYFFGKSAGVWKSYGIILMIVALTVVYLFWRYLNSPEILRAVEGDDSSKS